jgi:hypothetical protein
MRDYTDYLNSLENADITHTEEEWKEIIHLEAKDMEDEHTINDIDFIIDCLWEDGFVKEETT